MEEMRLIVSRYYRTLFSVIFLLAAFTVLEGMPVSAFAAEIKGKVTAISGDVVTIRIPPGKVPKVGDKVDIGFDIPGGDAISIGVWRVIEVGTENVKAAVKEAFGDPDVGMTATIFASSSAEAAKTAANPPPVSPGSRAAGGGKGGFPGAEIATKKGGGEAEGKDDSLARARREMRLESERLEKEQRRLREERERLEAERKRFEEDRRRSEAERKRVSSLKKGHEGNENEGSGKRRHTASAPSQKEPSPKAAHMPAPLDLPRMIKGKDGAPMLLVPAGEFMRGDTFKEGEEDERPARKIFLDAFYIDKYPVTNGLYRKMIPNGEIQGKDDLPVKNIYWEDAKSYCEKAGKRLPTEAEWEKAARGTDGRRYPWGNEWDSSKLVWLLNSLGTQPVNRSSQTHESPYGVVDMVGNLSEWVSDWYQDDYYKFAPSRNPLGPSRSDLFQRRVVRGGSYLSGDPKSFRVSARGWVMPLTPLVHVGFRCAIAAK